MQSNPPEAEDYISPALIDEAENPRNMERLFEADGCSSVQGECGDTVEFYLKVEGATIKRASFRADGCGVTAACGSMTTRLAEGKTLAEAFNLRPEHIVAQFGRLPEGHEHCPTLCITALRCAIRDCAVNKGWRSLEG